MVCLEAVLHIWQENGVLDAILRETWPWKTIKFYLKTSVYIDVSGLTQTTNIFPLILFSLRA